MFATLSLPSHSSSNYSRLLEKAGLFFDFPTFAPTFAEEKPYWNSSEINDAIGLVTPGNSCCGNDGCTCKPAKQQNI